MYLHDRKQVTKALTVPCAAGYFKGCWRALNLQRFAGFGTAKRALSTNLRLQSV